MIKNIKERITEYFNLKFEIIRLELIERLVNVMGYLIFTVLAIFLSFSFLLFLGFGLAEWFGDMLNKPYYGYFIVGGIMLLGLLITIWKSGTIVKFFADKFVSLLTSSSAQKEAEAITAEKLKEKNGAAS